MMDKIKKDTDTVKSNPFLQFMIAAAPWVMMGVGVACIAASISKSHR